MGNRRSFLKAGGALAGVGSVAMVSPTLADSLVIPDLSDEKTETKLHQHRPLSGPLASATVSFGQWSAAPLDRFPNVSAPVVRNQHQLIPNEVTIKAGGAVNFIVAGFHNIIVYDDGTQPTDINVNSTVPPTAGGPPLINDTNNRIYRGLDP
ncbi:MAG: twin-arginine translocation signal domain-containing protein, partial [Acidobacteria bacterium]|nr:twin-arginine translocation signal domain-containing protein [Acidobacteriota bacterium]